MTDNERGKATSLFHSGPITMDPVVQAILLRIL